MVGANGSPEKPEVPVQKIMGKNTTKPGKHCWDFVSQLYRTKFPRFPEICALLILSNIFIMHLSFFNLQTAYKPEIPPTIW